MVTNLKEDLMSALGNTRYDLCLIHPTKTPLRHGRGQGIRTSRVKMHLQNAAQLSGLTSKPVLVYADFLRRLYCPGQSVGVCAHMITLLDMELDVPGNCATP